MIPASTTLPVTSVIATVDEIGPHLSRGVAYSWYNGLLIDPITILTARIRPKMEG